MLNTYRKWKETWEIFYLESYDKEDNTYYCEACYYADSWNFEKDYIEKNSVLASSEEIEDYKKKKLLYN